MVTDEEYNALKERVKILEDRMKKLSDMIMRNDAPDPVEINDGSSDKKNKGFKKHKDKTKYLFNGNTYCKRRLVLECVKYYVNKNDITHYDDFIEVFPDDIQGSLGVIRNIDAADKYGNAKSRFFFRDDDIIKFEDGSYVVCSQWSNSNIEKFLKLADDLGLEIKVIKRKYNY